MENTARWRGRGAVRQSSTRFKIVVASLIALTSLLAALAAWRAEVASMKGEDSERKGFADSVANEQAAAQIRSGLQDTLLSYERAQFYRAQAIAFRKRAARAPAADGARLRAQATAQEGLAKVVLGTIDRDALRPDGSLDLKRKFQLDYTLAKSAQDIDSKPDFARSDSFSTKSERLVGLTAMLIAAAFFFTLAQVTRRRTKPLYVGGGLIVLVAATVLFVIVEVAT